MATRHAFLHLRNKREKNGCEYRNSNFFYLLSFHFSQSTKLTALKKARFNAIITTLRNS